MAFLLYVCPQNKDGEFMSEATLTKLQKEMVDLKIRVNNLEKKMSMLNKKPTPKRQSFI